MKYTIGIDEVGRGPIAGPVVVCACAVLTGSELLYLFPKQVLKDSKKLSEKVREAIAQKVEVLVCEKKIIYGIGEVSAEAIDEIGISQAIRDAMNIALQKVVEQGVTKESKVFLDGSLKAGEGWKNQETVIKGDEKIIEITLASIIAKVYRDTLMKKLGEEECVGYGFENHAGYGTKAHYDAITKLGMTLYHRRSFLKKLL